MLLFYDPFYMAVFGVGLLLSLWASAKTKGAFRKYSKLPTRSGMTGAQVAAAILRDHGVHDVTIEPVPGELSDHYDPKNKVLRLSEPVHDGRSMAAFGVAAHEVGHALQDAQEYAPLNFRSAWVPVANTGSGLAIFIIIAAMVLQGMQSVWGEPVAWLGLALFATSTIFTVVTLPVEFDASRRALEALEAGRYADEEELRGAKKVLDAAALTYVAAAVASLLMLLYWAVRLGLLGGRDD